MKARLHFTNGATLDIGALGKSRSLRGLRIKYIEYSVTDCQDCTWQEVRTRFYYNIHPSSYLGVLLVKTMPNFYVDTFTTLQHQSSQ